MWLPFVRFAVGDPFDREIVALRAAAGEDDLRRVGPEKRGDPLPRPLDGRLAPPGRRRGCSTDCRRPPRSRAASPRSPVYPSASSTRSPDRSDSLSLYITKSMPPGQTSLRRPPLPVPIFLPSATIRLTETTLALFRRLADAGLGGIDLVIGPVRDRRQVRHDDVGAAGKPQLPAFGQVERRQGGRAGDVGLRADDPCEGDRLVGHQLVGGDLLPGRRGERSGALPRGVPGWGMKGPTPIMSRSSSRNSSISGARSS